MNLWIAGLFILPAVLLLAAVVWLWHTQETNIYRPRRYTQQEKAALAGAAVPLDYATTCGPQQSWYVPPRGCPEREPQSVWLLFSGSGSLGGDWLDFVQNYPDAQTGFLLMDYPGYADNPGEPSEASMDEAALSAWKRLQEFLSLSETELTARSGILGISLGGALCLYLARKTAVRRVVLVCTFTSLHDMAARRYSRFITPLLRHAFDNHAMLRELCNRDNPPEIVLLHGAEDTLVAPEMSRELVEKSCPEAHYTEIPGANHWTIVTDYRDRVYEAMTGTA